MYCVDTAPVRKKKKKKKPMGYIGRGRIEGGTTGRKKGFWERDVWEIHPGTWRTEAWGLAMWQNLD